MTRRSVALPIALVAALVAAAAGGAQNLPAPAPPPGVGFDQNLGAQIPLDLTFRDASGASVHLADFFGAKPVVLSLVYFDCPMLCPMSLDGLTKSLAALKLGVGEDFEVVTVSFNPRETPAEAAAKKQHYVGRYGRAGAAAGWHFLTGDEASIHRLTEAVGFRYVWDEKSGQYAHPTGVVVATPQGKVARYFYGIDYPPTDLRLGLVEASHGTVGNVVDQVLLLCYQYDPATGKYTSVAIGSMRVAGALTLLVIGGCFFVAWRRSKSRRDGA